MIGVWPRLPRNPIFEEVRRFYRDGPLSDDLIRIMLAAPGFRTLCERLAEGSLQWGPDITDLFLKTAPDLILDDLLISALGWRQTEAGNELASLGAALALAERNGEEPDEDLPELGKAFAKKIIAEAERRSGCALWPVALEPL
jgi:hypothetical protein